MARALAEAGVWAQFSYAGRTAAPLAQPLPVRVGGFGGVAGLVAYLRAQRITHVIDATHPFAAQMSAHAVAACAEAGVGAEAKLIAARALGLPVILIERPFVPQRRVCGRVSEVMGWLHEAVLGL